MEMRLFHFLCIALVLNILVPQHCHGQINTNDGWGSSEVSNDCHHGMSMQGLCMCYPGFEGVNCDKYSPTSPCYGQPCKNGGTCFPTQGGRSLQCYCTEGFSGEKCEKSPEVVVNISPLNGGLNNSTAQNSSDGNVPFNQTNNTTHGNDTDNWNSDFNNTLQFNNETGIFVDGTFDNSTQDGNETDWYDDQFNSTLTFNNETMDNYTNYGSNNSMHCNYTTCRAGQCVATENNTSICVCLDGWAGPTCEELAEENPCFNNTCMNGASCLPNFNLTDYECFCANGFAGINCEFEGNDTEIALDSCDDYPCMNNGSCVSNGTSYVCNCPDEFEGTVCELKIPKPCDPSPCANGQCSEINNGTSYTCDCYFGYEGRNCDWISGIRVCEETPCQNGGSCQRFGPTSYKCTCAIGYAGRNCDIYLGTACDRNPCEQGTCTPTGINEYRCRCNLGYLGRNCDRQVEDICSLGQCQNGGTCLRNANETNSYKCLCYWGYSGRNCERYVGTACDTNPCQHGTCSLSTNTQYTCACFPGYTGQYCEHRLTACYRMPCSNGYCTNLAGGSDYRCTCYGGYGGRNCDRYIGLPCSNNECHNGGQCRNVNNYRDFQCTCRTGYYGRQCQFSMHATTAAPTTVPEPITEESTVPVRVTEESTTVPVPVTEESTIGRCGGNFNETRGILTSPSYPDVYPPRSRCIYKIHLKKQQKIELKFDTFDLEASIFSCYDSLKIYDGGYSGSRRYLAAMACGKRHGLEYTSRTNLIYVVFTSDRSIQKRGFYATYVAVEDESPCNNDPCGNNGECIPVSARNYRCRCKSGYVGKRCESRVIIKSFSDSYGVVASPNYYKAYSDGLRCIFTIRARRYRHVLLVFEHFHLASPNEKGQCTEMLKIIDGSHHHGRTVFKGCGILSPGTLSSSSNRFTIFYATDNALAGHGFKATYMTRK